MNTVEFNCNCSNCSSVVGFKFDDESNELIVEIFTGENNDSVVVSYGDAKSIQFFLNRVLGE